MNAIYKGMNATFDAFVKFAQDSIKAGNENAIARLETSGLKGRTITAATNDKVGGFSSLIRSRSNVRANNDTRADFKEAVMDLLRIFGMNDDKIPASLLDVIKEKDYGKGKPLTARRIMLVAEAINTRYAPKGSEHSPVDKVVISAGHTVDKVSDAIKKNDFAGAVKAMQDRYASMTNAYPYGGATQLKAKALYMDLADACKELHEKIEGPLGLEEKDAVVEKMKNILLRERNNLKKLVGDYIRPQRTGKGPAMPEVDEDGTMKVDNLLGNYGKDMIAESKTIKFYTTRMDDMEKFQNDILSIFDKIDWE